MAKRKNKSKIYIVILIIFLVFSLIFNTLFIKIKEKIDKSLFPIQSKIFSTSSLIEKVSNLETIIKENEKLKFENMKLKENDFLFESVKEENKRLVKLLGIKEEFKGESEVKAARIIYKNIYNLYNEIHIDLGELEGAKVDMAVVYDRKLVGKIIKVYEKYSVVELITSPKMRVSVTSDTGMLGITQGNDEEDGKLYFQPSTFEDSINEGSQLLTSGISRIYPEGLKIGKIAKISKDENYLFKSIEVEPAYKIKDLREVIVLSM